MEIKFGKLRLILGLSAEEVALQQLLTQGQMALQQHIRAENDRASARAEFDRSMLDPDMKLEQILAIFAGVSATNPILRACLAMLEGNLAATRELGERGSLPANERDHAAGICHGLTLLRNRIRAVWAKANPPPETVDATGAKSDTPA